jgi:SAM-dependent methyltransferase
MTHPVEVTIRTYDRIAARFAARHWDVRLDRALEGFAHHLPSRAWVLDLGCGPGRDIALLRERGYRVVGLDRSMGMLREARRRVGGMLVCGDMRSLPLADASLDGVWMCATLLHLPRAEAPAALAEVRRVSRDGAGLYISVRRGEGEVWDEADGPRFFAYYQPDELLSLVEGAGYTVREHWLDPVGGITWINLIAVKERGNGD